MAEIAILDVSQAGHHKIVGKGTQTVFLNDKPLACVGSITASGVAIVKPPVDHKVYAEDRQVARVGDTLADGKKILTGAKNT